MDKIYDFMFISKTSIISIISISTKYKQTTDRWTRFMITYQILILFTYFILLLSNKNSFIL